MRKIVLVLFSIVLVSSCSSSKKLVYLDEWEGNYVLRKFDSCCDSAMTVSMQVSRENTDRYSWKMFYSEGRKTDTIYGKALYAKKKIGFFVENADDAATLFAKPVSSNRAVFEMEFSNYYTEGDKLYVDHFTSWQNELKKYPAKNAMFAGVHYHFKSVPKKTTRLTKKR